MNYEGLSIERINHDCFKIKGSKIIYIDPYQIGSVDEKADIVLITHEHYDHCSPTDVVKVAGPKTVIITVADCQSKISSIEVKQVVLVEPGKKVGADDIIIEAVPAYNINKHFHPKEQDWVGFIINIDGKRIYHAGDTDLIPEMSTFQNIDIALLPVSGTYVMNVAEAVEACKRINPKLAIPMHYGAIVGTQNDAEEFKQRAPCRVEVI